VQLNYACFGEGLKFIGGSKDSVALLALDAKSNYACFGEGLKFIGDSKDSVSVFVCFWMPFGVPNARNCRKMRWDDASACWIDVK
jgi:hypothetical protein